MRLKSASIFWLIDKVGNSPVQTEQFYIEHSDQERGMGSYERFKRFYFCFFFLFCCVVVVVFVVGGF